MKPSTLFTCGAVTTSTPFLLQPAHVRLEMLQVVGDEGDLGAERLHHADEARGAHRARVLVGRQHARLDHEDPDRRGAIALEARHHAVHPVVAKRGLPALAEFRLVLHLVALHAFREVGAVGYALEVDDFRRGLVIDAATRFACTEAEVRILAVGRHVALVETAEGFEKRARNEQARARAVVGFAHIVVFRLRRVVAAPVVPCGTVAPHDAARLLQAPVGVDEFAPATPAFGSRSKIARSASSDPGCTDDVVVEEKEIVAARERCAAIAVAHEPEVGHVPLEAHALHDREAIGGGFRRAVVHDEDLERHARALGGERAQARVRVQVPGRRSAR
jgi:hypothetical protein